jgi:hypothetical protein
MPKREPCAVQPAPAKSCSKLQQPSRAAVDEAREAPVM